VELNIKRWWASWRINKHIFIDIHLGTDITKYDALVTLGGRQRLHGIFRAALSSFLRIYRWPLPFLNTRWRTDIFCFARCV